MWHCCCLSLHFVKGFLESCAVLQLGQLETLQSTFAGGAGGSLGPQGVSSMSQPSSLLCWERAGTVCRVGVRQRAQQLHEALACCRSVWTCGCGGRGPRGGYWVSSWVGWGPCLCVHTSLNGEPSGWPHSPSQPHSCAEETQVTSAALFSLFSSLEVVFWCLTWSTY